MHCASLCLHGVPGSRVSFIQEGKMEVELCSE